MIKKQKEEIVKHAVLKWQGEHPDKKYLDIKYRETIVLKGIGKVKKQALLKHFGSVEKIKNASLEELMEVKGITRELAEKLKE